MNDKLVSLEAVKRTLENAYYGEATLGELLEALDEISPVESQMSAVEYHNIAKRMSATDIRTFKLWWDLMRWLDDDALIVAKRWAQEHPEEVNNER